VQVVENGNVIVKYYATKGATMRQVTRVTVSLPRELWESVKRAVPAGKRSGLVAAALESELRRLRLQQVGQLRQFQKSMRKKYGELPASAADIEQMRSEHDNSV
jgi:metal-responsive CopG/Arc/MetJ family transcriptional regulator